MGMGAPAGFNPANPYQQLPQSTYGLSDDESFNNISGTLTAAYQLTESSSVFLRYATGYRSGGFNGESLSTDILGNPAANKYDEETIKQLELGYKSKLWRQRLQLNASLYHYTFDDAQVSTIGLTPGGAVNTSIVNAASATRTGGELELTALVTPDLLVSFGASFVSGDFDEFEFCGASTNCYYQDGVVINDKFVADHAERSNSPDTTINVAVDWTAARMSFGTLNVYMDASWRSDVSSAALWMSAQSDGDLIVYDAMMFDGYTLVNSRISLDDIEVGDGNLSVALWAKNLLDEEYQTFGINFGSLGIETRQWGSPRTVGLDLSYSF